MLDLMLKPAIAIRGKEWDDEEVHPERDKK